MAKSPLKNTRKKPSIGSDNKRKTKKGASLPKKTKTSRLPRFHTVEICLSNQEYESGLPYFDNKKYLSKFVLEAYREKVKRAEAHDKEARLRTLVSNMKIIEPLIRELYEQGKLEYLRELK